MRRRGKLEAIKMRNLLPLLGLLLVVAVVGRADEPERRLLVPFDDLHALMLQQHDHVLLELEAYEQMLADAAPPARVEAPPLSAWFSAAEYRLSVGEKIVMLEGELVLTIASDRLQAVPLPFRDLWILEATLDGRPAAIGGEMGKLKLFAQGVGDHRLRVRGMAALHHDVNRAFQMTVPTPASTRVTLSAGGDVDFTSKSVAILDRRYASDSDRTSFDLLLTGGRLDGAVGLNNRKAESTQALLAQGLIWSHLEPGGERLKVRMTYDILHRPTATLGLELPASFHVTDVSSASLSGWSVERQGETQVVTAQLHEEQVGEVVVVVEAWRSDETLVAWELPRIRPLEVDRFDALVAVSMAEQLELLSLDYRELLPLTLPELNMGWGEIPMRRLLTGYAPSGEAQVRAALRIPAGRIEAIHNLRLTVRRDRLDVIGHLRVTALEQPIQSLTLRIPEGWAMSSVTNWPVAAPAEERVAEPLFDVVDHGAEGQVLTIHLPGVLDPGRTKTLRYVASRVPVEWFTEWDEREVALPEFRLADATAVKGILTLHVEEDLRVLPGQVTGLEPLARDDAELVAAKEVDAHLAYRFSHETYAGSARVERVPAWLSARGETLFAIGREAIAVTGVLSFVVADAGVRKVSFLLPADSPTALRVVGLGATAVKEYHHEVTEAGNLWSVLLAAETRGEVQLRISFELPSPRGAVESLTLPVIEASSVRYQSGVVAVGGESELNVEMVEHPRRVDEGEMSHVGLGGVDRLTGVFSFTGSPPPVTVRVTRPALAELPPAIVQHATVAAVLGENGLQHCALEARLRSKLSFLHLQLPPDAILWSVTLDGRPSKPRQLDGAILLEVSSESDAEQELLVLYEVPGRSFSWRARPRLEAPRFLRQAPEGLREIPVVEMRWRISLPTGYRVIASDGAVALPGLEPVEQPFAFLGRVAYWLSGGVGFERGLLSGCVLAVGSTVSKARYKSMEYDDSVVESEVAAPEEFNERMYDEAPGAATAPEPAQVAKPMSKEDDGGSWGVAGARSLKISLQSGSDHLEFASLPEAAELELTIVRPRWWRHLGWFLAAVAMVIGLSLSTGESWQRWRYLFWLIVISGLVPLVPGLTSLALALNHVFGWAILLAIWYTLLPLISRIYGIFAQTAQRFKCGHALLWSVAFVVYASVQPSVHAEEERLPALSLAVPERAIIVPYDPAVPEVREKVLVPRVRLEELRRLLDPARGEVKPPVPWAHAGGALAATVGEDEALVLRGWIGVELYAAERVAIDLPLAGVALSRLVEEGRMVPLQPLAEKEGVRIFLEGKGMHRLEVEMRVEATRAGGARQVSFALPSLPVAHLEVTLPDAQTELQVLHLERPLVFRTTRAGERLQVPIGEGGQLSFRWQPMTMEGQVDRSLTVQSEAVFGVRLDRCELNWQLAFSFRGGARAAFDLLIPDGYEVERVTGDDVRGWSREENRVQVELLTPAAGHAAIGLMLWRGEVMRPEAAVRLDVPFVRVPDAVRHTGRIAIEHVPLLVLQTLVTEGVTRTRVDSPRRQMSGEDMLRTQAYDAFTFAAAGPRIQLEARQLQPRVMAEGQTLLRLSERRCELESRFLFDVQEGAVPHVALLLPATFTLATVSAPQMTGKILEEVEDGQRLTIFFESNRTGVVPVILSGELPAPDAEGGVELPRPRALDVARQSGHIVIQAPDAYDVQPRDLRNLTTVLPAQVAGWLSKEHMALARIVFRYTGVDFGGRVHLRRRRPDVTCHTLTNVRITEAAIEETLLLDFTVRQAGVDQLVFEMPEWMSEAEVKLPLLREKRIVPMVDEGRVRVELTLQQEVIGELRVLILNRRGLTEEAERAPIPKVLTGRTDRRLVALESAGRDEVVVEKLVGLTALNRQQQEWQAMAALLRGGSTQAYLAEASSDDPQLIYRSTPREAIETVGARIGLARTILVLDGSGAYRGQQTFHVNNRTESYLLVELPSGSTLYSVTVADQPVKPVVSTSERQFHIPLVKTAVGDLDYQVVLLYGGDMEAPGLWSSRLMPLAQALGINAELTQVELRLPREFWWWRFGGTMPEVTDAASYQADYLEYQSQQAKELVQTLKFGSAFERSRARLNWSKLSSEVEESQQVGNAVFNAKLAQQVQQSESILETGKQAIDAAQKAEQGAEGISNTFGITDYWRGQTNRAESADLHGLDYNFGGDKEASEKERKRAPRGKGKGGAVGDMIIIPKDEKLEGARNGESTSGQEMQQSGNLRFGMESAQEQQPFIVGLSMVQGESDDRGYLASLPAALPDEDAERWQVYRFSKPRGDAVIRAHGLAMPLLVAIRQLFMAVLIILVLALIGRGLHRVAAHGLGGDRSSKWLMLVGLVFLLVGFLPLLGLAMMLIGWILRVVHRRRERRMMMSYD